MIFLDREIGRKCISGNEAVEDVNVRRGDHVVVCSKTT